MCVLREPSRLAICSKGADNGREFLVTRLGEVAHRGVRGLIDQQRELRSLALSS